MGEKIYLTIPIDEEVFFNFSNAVKQHGNGKSKYAMLEYLMQRYVNSYPLGPNTNTSPNPAPPDFELTEKLLSKCSNYKVGKLAKIVLRELLERGVATDYEITEFQKANGDVQVEKFGTNYGLYVNKTFGLAFPLLVTKEKRQKDPKIFYTTPLNIDGNEYYLCSQWNDGYREKLEAWIRKSLPKWLERTDEYSRNDMINWIENF